MFTLMTFFGDDVQSAADGPYTGAAKLRKWVLLFSAAAAPLTLHYLDVGALDRAVKLLKITYVSIALPVLAALFYAWALYVCWLWQLWKARKIVIDDRLRNQHQRRLVDVEEHFQTALTALVDAVQQPRFTPNPAIGPQQERMAASQARLEALPAKIKEMIDGGAAEDSPEVMHQKALLKMIPQELTLQANLLGSLREGDMHRAGRGPNVSRLQETAEKALATRNEALEQDPTSVPQYRQMEWAKDFLRFAPPLVLGFFALLNLSLAILETVTKSSG